MGRCKGLASGGQRAVRLKVAPKRELAETIAPAAGFHIRCGSNVARKMLNIYVPPAYTSGGELAAGKP